MVDVCLVSEGAYPHTIGGVAAWTHEHLGAHPELSFSVVNLREDGDPIPPRRYATPPNASVVQLSLDPAREGPPPSLAGQLPDARVYHGLATGAAGALAGSAAALRGRPFVLTEHGLAWREAAIGISACKPIGSMTRRTPRGQVAAAVRAMARESYRQADVVTSVSLAGSVLQRREGAPAGRQLLTPNAAPCAPAPAAVPRGAGPFRVGFVGRVVRIKDLETFVRACALVAGELPGCEFAVIGPLDQEPEYADRCTELADQLGLGEALRFCGEQEPEAALGGLDVMVLTSLSEAQPRVVLEAMAAGVPVIATDVGGCRELLRGIDPADRETGPAGVLTPVRDPRATADAILALARDPERRTRLGAAGRRRAETRYAPARVHASWGRLYHRWLERGG
jgi:glycosyltransferase involved in cell wall biosynthesis